MIFALTASPLGAAALPGWADSRWAACPFQVALTTDRTTGATPLLVHFNATVSSGNPTDFNWTFGDGTVWDDVGGASSAPLHRYSQPGSYDASVAVTESGCVASASVTVTVVVGPLAVVMTARPTSGPAPLSVMFNATVSGGTGTYGTAIWAFGDGGVGSGYDLVYTYTHPGRFTAVLNVTDSSGHWAIASASIGVSGPTPSASGLGSEGIPPWMVVGTAALGGAVVAATSYLRTRVRSVPRPDGPGRTSNALLGGPEVSPSPSDELSEGSATSPPGPGSPEPSPIGPGRSPAPARVAPTSGASPDQFRLTERTILHIGRQGSLGRDDLAPPGLTQAGMAEALGVGQNSLTNVLRRLVAAGVLVQEVRHVRGRPRRLRVYVFTARGETIFRDLRSRPNRSSGRPPDPRGSDGPNAGS